MGEIVYVIDLQGLETGAIFSGNSELLSHIRWMMDWVEKHQEN